jgi:helix-turn-helix protein
MVSDDVRLGVMMINFAENTASEGLLTTEQAARFLNVSEAFLIRDRWLGKRTGKGPRVATCLIGRCVRYRVSDLHRFVEANVVGRSFQTSESEDVIKPANQKGR